jgi:hypothetical protein
MIEVTHKVFPIKEHVFVIDMNDNILATEIVSVIISLGSELNVPSPSIRYGYRVGVNGEKYADAINVFEDQHHARVALCEWGYRSCGNVNLSLQWSSRVQGKTRDTRGYEAPLECWS